jgi:UDP-N-acetylmuramyl pentapeptide synthase
MNARQDPLWTAAELVEAVQGTAASTLADDITGVSIDSRTVQPGEAFVALVGPNFDGHDYVAKALATGAGLAIVARRPAGLDADAALVLVDDTQAALERLGARARARAKAHVVAVTGSVGKTSTKDAAPDRVRRVRAGHESRRRDPRADGPGPARRRDHHHDRGGAP